MALMRLFVFLIFSAMAFGDPISVTIFNQTTETTAETLAGGVEDQHCAASNAFSSTCHSQATGISGQTIAAGANASISAVEYPSRPTTTYINESAFAGNYLSYGTASATLSESVLITGGTGTGYLNVVFTVSAGGGGFGTANIAVGGQALTSQGSVSAPPVWAVVPFTFGQPFDYSVSLGTGVDNQGDVETSQLRLDGAHVYSTPPAGCTPAQFSPEYGFCSDPNYVDATGHSARSLLRQNQIQLGCSRGSRFFRLLKSSDVSVDRRAWLWLG